MTAAAPATLGSPRYTPMALKVLTSKVPTPLAARVDRLVAEESSSRSSLIRRALVLYLDLREDVDPLLVIPREQETDRVA